MAELIIKVGPNRPGLVYQDGDILHCFNNRRVRWTWAEELCHTKYFGFTRDGLRPKALPWKYRQHTHRYQMTRVSRKEVLRYDTRTGVTDLFNDRPDANGEYIHVEQYLKRRLAHHNHVIFGTPGREEWYGGYKDFSQAVMTKVWQDIEADTPFRESSFLDFPLSPHDQQHVLALRIDDLSDAEAEEYQRALKEPCIDVHTGRESERLLLRRVYHVPYEEILSPCEVQAVRDRTKVTDYRDHHVPLSVIQSKVGVPVWQS